MAVVSYLLQALGEPLTPVTIYVRRKYQLRKFNFLRLFPLDKWLSIIKYII